MRGFRATLVAGVGFPATNCLADEKPGFSEKAGSMRVESYVIVAWRILYLTVWINQARSALGTRVLGLGASW